MFDSTNNTTASTPKTEYNCKVTHVRKTKKDDLLMFDMTVNGVDLKSLMLKEVTVKKDGKKYKAGDKAYIINFYSTKSNADGRYYNNYFFPISSELQDNIIDQIKSLLG